MSPDFFQNCYLRLKTRSFFIVKFHVKLTIIFDTDNTDRDH